MIGFFKRAMPNAAKIAGLMCALAQTMTTSASTLTFFSGYTRYRTHRSMPDAHTPYTMPTPSPKPPPPPLELAIHLVPFLGSFVFWMTTNPPLSFHQNNAPAARLTSCDARREERHADWCGRPRAWTTAAFLVQNEPMLQELGFVIHCDIF